LPIYLGNSAWAWLEYLPKDSIQSRSDLRDVFIGNFQGTYKRPSNSWDLQNCKQSSGETLREYIRHFSKKCNELPDVVDADVVMTFLSGTSNRGLVHEFGRTKPQTTKKLLDIAANFASGERRLMPSSARTPGRRSKVTLKARP
jgi:hypothetical protein